MRIFVTGATGFVGSAVVAEAMARGHEVTGLARNDAAAARLATLGAKEHRGDLVDLQSLRDGARGVDAVIHTGFNHDFTRFAESCAEDERAIEALGEGLASSGGKLIVTSGTGGLSYGRLATENDNAPSRSESYPRQSEAAAARVVARGVPVAVMRLPNSVHGDGDQGFISFLVAFARQNGVSGYIGDGQNRWPATHRLDVARAYLLALEHGDFSGRYHPVAEEGVPVRLIAEKIGAKMGLPAASVESDDAAAHFAWFAHFVGADMAASSARTREKLGWSPEGPDIMADLELDSYYAQ